MYFIVCCERAIKPGHAGLLADIPDAEQCAPFQVNGCFFLLQDVADTAAASKMKGFILQRVDETVQGYFFGIPGQGEKGDAGTRFTGKRMGSAAMDDYKRTGRIKERKMHSFEPGMGGEENIGETHVPAAADYPPEPDLF